MPIAVPAMNQFTPTPIGAASTVAPVQVADPALVQDQLAGILNKGGPLMQQAATYGNQQAQSRGLLNSSMGVQAAQAATMDRATPIAQSDANAINAINQQNAAIQNTANQYNATAQNQFSQFDAQNANASGQWNAGQQNAAALQTMDTNSRETLAGIEANYKQLMQVNSSAEAMYNQALKNIADINMSADVADKAAAVASQLSYLRSGMTMVQNLNGISGLITF